MGRGLFVEVMMTDAAQTEQWASEPGRAERLLTLYGITGKDLERIRKYGKLVSDRIDVYVDKFYTWLARQPDYPRFFSDPAALAREDGVGMTASERSRLDEGHRRQDPLGAALEHRHDVGARAEHVDDDGRTAGLCGSQE